MSYENHRYVLMTVDPVHVGTGGMRLGRVDLSIVREPGTNLPKIPGTALHGAIRSYAAYRYGKRRCAGLGQAREGREGHCGRPTCPICYTFGYVKGETSEQAHSGVVSIGDARILLFPVYSMVGPVWVTSPSTLADFGNKNLSVQEGKAKWPKGLTAQGHLNLGWLMVEKEGEWTPPGDLTQHLPDPVKGRIVLISDKLFIHVANSNLEVRTSVSINPETGAAEEGALFTYEAIPRATFLWLDVVVDDYREGLPYRGFPNKERLEKWEKILEGEDKAAKKELLERWRLWNEEQGDEKLGEAVNRATNWIKGEKVQEDNQERWRWDTKPMQNVDQSPLGIVTAGLEWAEHLGIGGMGTRGFGRLRKVAEV